MTQRDLTDQLLLLQDVHVIVEDALRRFSQDRTGLPDYALESGGQRSQSVFHLQSAEIQESLAASPFHSQDWKLI